MPAPGGSPVALVLQANNLLIERGKRVGKEPTGAWDCTYSYEKVGELSIDELEGGRLGSCLAAARYC